MGGGTHRLAETEHYNFWLPWDGTSYREFPWYHHVKIECKHGGKEIILDDAINGDEYKIVHEAFAELEKERSDQINLKGMTDDQLTLADMYKRMTIGERDAKIFREKYRVQSEIIYSLSEEARKLQSEKAKEFQKAEREANK